MLASPDRGNHLGLWKNAYRLACRSQKGWLIRTQRLALSPNHEFLELPVNFFVPRTTLEYARRGKPFLPIVQQTEVLDLEHWVTQLYLAPRAQPLAAP